METRLVSDGDQQPCIGALLTHEQNRRLLGEWLSTNYDVVAPDPSETSFPSLLDRTDLLLLDAGAYERHPDFIATYRARDDSLFRPVLLVSEDEPQNIPDVLLRVDDIVRLPVEKAILRARIEGLLSRRALSRDAATSEDRFRTLFDLGPDPAVVVDGRGAVVESNAAFHEVFDVPPEECHGKPLSAISAFDQTAIETITAGEVTDGRTVISYQVEGGEPRYAECTRRLLHSPGETTRSTDTCRQIIVLRDITDRIDREQELERQIERLDEFAGVLAHEMRNPLGIASGWLEQARATGDPDAFARIEAAHERIDDMTSALLQLARQGRIIGERSAVGITTLVTESWDAVMSAEATLVISPELTDRTLTGDRKRLQEVFTNLFRNAVEHGGPEVTVEVGVLEDGDGIYVADDGPGLGAVDRDQLFAPGYTTTTDGTGFGLAIVEQIANAHGWTVRGTTAEDGGARFELLGVALGGMADEP